MKLIVVLMLAALPLYCYAGSGCPFVEKMVKTTLNSNVSTAEYIDVLKHYINDERTELAVVEFKNCFLSQSEETLRNVVEMMVISISSYLLFKITLWELAGSKFLTNEGKATDIYALKVI
uniref:Secretoglobin family 2A member 2 n=1 Tax=Oryctolagus cuniculus TaxID=9986 RepID=A0A5F9CKL9_RABIT